MLLWRPALGARSKAGPGPKAWPGPKAGPRPKAGPGPKLVSDFYLILASLLALVLVSLLIEYLVDNSDSKHQILEEISLARLVGQYS